MAEYPDEATFLGQPGKYDRWPDYSSKAFAEREKFTHQFLAVLNTIQLSALEQKDAVNGEIFKRSLEEDLAGYQFGSHFLAVNQMQGVHLHIPSTLSMMPNKTITDYENILSRLKHLPLFYQQIMELLEEGIAAGITPPRVAIRTVPAQILNQIVEQPLESPFLKAFTQFPLDFNEDAKSSLVQQAESIYREKVLPSLNQFYVYVAEHYLPQCRKNTSFSDLPNGLDWYDFYVKSATTTTLTAAQIHAIGVEEVKRIHKEMLSLIKSTGFQGTFEEFLHFLKTDPQFFYKTREDLLQGYQLLTKHIETKLPLLFDKLPMLPFEVHPVPSYSEESQGTAYYCPGSLQDNRPGKFFINTSFPLQRAKWEMEPLALHEAVPGHHLQISLAQENPDLPAFRQNTNFTAYIEGWGLYSESLGKEIGLYQDPYSSFGRLTYEMLRAIRLVVDTGMHAMGWSRERAISYFKQYLSMSDHEIITEVDRYLVVPGQALAYKIGELKIQEMRRNAASILKQKFDVREFHHAWLQQGAVPLDVAETQITQWIERTLIDNSITQ